MAMLGLMDVMPASERVVIGKNKDGEDVSVDVSGLSAEDIWKLMVRYPNLFSALSNAKGNPQGMDPKLLADLIAASTRAFDDQEATERARRLPIAVQLNILQAMGRVTFPDGFGPFLESLKSISGSVQGAVEVVIKDQVTTSPPPERPSEPPPTPPSGN